LGLPNQISGFLIKLQSQCFIPHRFFKFSGEDAASPKIQKVIAVSRNKILPFEVLPSSKETGVTSGKVRTAPER
jgi:hypothetical protein